MKSVCSSRIEIKKKYKHHEIQNWLLMYLIFLVAADIFLWRDKKISGGVLGVATAIWVLFELLEYHLLSLVCHVLILGLAILFLWSNACSFINKYDF